MAGYAVIELGGKQHRVSVGEKILVDLQAEKNVGDNIDVNNVLMIGGESYKVGTPYVDGASVSCSVSHMGRDGQGVKGEKIRVFKKNRRKGFTKTIGHRQKFTELTINDIKG